MIAHPRVLVVDDEPVVIKSCYRILANEGIEVEGITSGRDGLKRAESSCFNAILLDLKMPDMNGMEILRRIKKTKPESIIIVITGFASMDTAIEAFRLGAFDYVPKPFTPEELAETVKRALALQKLVKEVEPSTTTEVMGKLLKALEECGEIAAFYKGESLLMANELFADLFGKDVEEFKGLSILEIFHEESFDLIRDFIRRREYGDRNVPTTYKAAFRTPNNPKAYMIVTVLKTINTEGAFLIILQEKK